MWRALLLLLSASLAVTPQTKKPRNGAAAPADGLMAKLAGGFQFATGIVWSKEGFLLFSDTPSGRILKVTTEGTSVFREGLRGPQGLAVDDDGRIYICETRARRVLRIGRRGKLDVLADQWDGKPLNGPNDIALGKGGHVYFTDPAFASADSSRALDFYGVFHLSPKGEITVAAKPPGRPNGIALSPDGKLLYVADSDHRSVLVYDVGRNGALSGERTWISGIPGVPDGLRADKAGNLYVAARDLLVYSPDGKPLRSVPIGEKPSSSTWGDGDLGTLYITTRTSVYRLRAHAEEPH